MTEEEAAKYIKERCIRSSEERDGTKWSDAMWTAIEALMAKDVVEKITQDLADKLNDAYNKGYNAAKREIALSGEYERAYQRGKEDATKWNPVSEKPEPKEKTYLIQTNSGYVCSCRWTNVNHFWTDLTTDWHWHIMDVPQYSKVVAWMEKPELFEPESEE